MVPLGPIQPDMAPTFAILAALNLLVLLGTRRGLAGGASQPTNGAAITSTGPNVNEWSIDGGR